MSNIAIRVENLGKQYRIGEKQVGYRTIREAILNSLAAPVRWLHRERKVVETFWALHDVTFEVNHGDTIGIIGRNGAGKSTLLKLLSRITTPTRGRIELYGRVASLLEVGTGFHPELTGRDNIYLNGAILGMSRSEIYRKFDEIVDFAEVERFLDTPVKHYSSGMYVRLAFAVAAHLEPEILVVDEVLAVGDAEFQKKCLGKMSDVAREGRTVLFVSHNMVAIQQLCQQGLVLKEGKVYFTGEIENAVNKYSQSVRTEISGVNLAQRNDRKGNGRLKFVNFAIYNSVDQEIHQVLSGQDARLRFFYVSEMEQAEASVLFSFNIRSERGYLLANLNSVDTGNNTLEIYSKGFFECHWPKIQLRSGTYDCNLFCSVNGEIADWIQNAFMLHVEDGDYYNTGKLIERQQGDILIEHSWRSGPI